MLSLTTGVLLGLLTPWGLFRHWWVTAKLALTTAGAVLSLVQRLELVRDSGAASLVLLTTLVLSVYKPFGRVFPVRGGARGAPAPRP